MGRTESNKFSGDDSSDSEDRVQDFLSRHGGAAASPPREEAINPGLGWSEVYAADGYTLRCDWSQVGMKKEMSFSELPPTAAKHAN